MSSIKNKLMAKSAGIREQVDAEMSKSSAEKSAHPRTAIGHAGAFQVAINQSEAKIKELEARVKDLSSTTVPVADVVPNPWQPRKVFTPADIEKLADSIAELGLIQPIIVRRKSVPNRDTFSDKAHDGESVPKRDTFELVAGERRWRAHQLLNSAEIKAIVVEISDADMAMMALAENLDREDLTDFETSEAIRRITNEFPSKRQFALAIGIRPQELEKYLSYGALPDFILDDLAETPWILGRNAAESIKSAIKKHGDQALDSLLSLWPRVKSGDLDQGKIATTIESIITRGATTKTERDIKKLYIGKEQAGSITRDAAKFQVTIKTAALSPEREAELRAFLERMFAA